MCIGKTSWHKTIYVDYIVIIITILLFICKLNMNYKGSLYIIVAIMILFYIMYNIYYYIK